MAEEKTLTVIRGQIDSTAALQNVAGMTADIPVVSEGSVLYPYMGFTARCTIPTIIGRQSISVNCLVDGVNGLGATAHPFSTERIFAGDLVRLQAKITSDDARRTAQRTIAHRLGKQLKMIAPFNIQLKSTGVIYKRFWIIGIGDGRIMTDSVTGNMHALGATAA